MFFLEIRAALYILFVCFVVVVFVWCNTPDTDTDTTWTRPDETRQDKTRQDKTRQDKTRQAVQRGGLTRGSPARHGVGRDDARVAQRAEVQAEAVVVVLAHQLGVHLGHAVDGARPLDRQVRGGVAGGVRPEGTCHTHRET